MKNKYELEGHTHTCFFRLYFRENIAYTLITMNKRGEAMLSSFDKNKLLSTYNIKESDLLGAGMEAEVYRYGPDKVLKVYHDRSEVDNIKLLQNFYAQMQSGGSDLSLPYIYEVIEENGALVTIEAFFQGENAERIFPSLDEAEQNLLFHTYLQACLALKTINKPDMLKGNILFTNLVSHTSHTCWHEVLLDMIMTKQKELEFYLQKDVIQYHEKIQQIQAVLSEAYTGDYALIHGDYHPGNIMIKGNLSVTGLLDFGMLTMYGDNLFDLAIGWVCFDMYNGQKSKVNERYLDVVLAELGEDVRSKLYRYVLIYSFITANFYAENCDDGHYKWCVANLNNRHYWEKL